MTEDGELAEARRQIGELITAVAARDGFIALMGHELRNAIAPMVLLAEQFSAAAVEGASMGPPTSKVAMLNRHLNRFVALIDRVAEVADLRRGKLRLDLDAVDLVEVVAEVCRSAEREAAAGGTSLLLDAPHPVVGQWDRMRVKQIVANLISNAIRYGGGGSVEISVRGRADAGELVISDHGPGIDPAVLPWIFDRFDHEHNRRAGGLGIGLWLVKMLCSAMHGTVTAENRANGGASFCVVLPRGSITHG